VRTSRLTRGSHLGVAVHRFARVLQVDPGAEAHTGRGKVVAPIAQRDDRGHGQPAPGRITGKHRTARRDALAQEPAIRRHGVLERCRMRILGRPPIVNCQRLRLRSPREARHHLPIIPERADNVAAAGEVEDGPPGCRARRDHPFGRDTAAFTGWISTSAGGGNCPMNRP
jgi:hypothetical protein